MEKRFTRRELLRRAVKTVVLAPVGYVAATEAIHLGLAARSPLIYRIFDWLDTIWPH